MADDFTDDSIAVEDAPDFSTESVAVEPLPSPSHPPAIRDEPLPAEDTYVSHLALPLPLRPLPPITSERLTVPEPSGPSVFERFNRLGQPVYDTPTEPTVDVFSQRDKSLIEDAQSRMVLKDRIEKMGSPVSTGLRESAVSGIQGLASNTGLAAAAGVAVAPQIAVPALFAATVPQVPEVIERIQKAREEGDRPAYYRAVGDALQTFAVLGVTLPSTLRLPRSLDAWRESVGARAEARFQAAKDITPRPPLQLPERFVEPPTTGGPSAVPIRKTTPLLRDVPEQQVERQPEVPATPSAGGVSPSVKGPEETPKPATVPLTDPVGNSPEFYSLPRLRALDRSKDPRLAAAKKYYGAKTIPDLARLAKARFDEMAAKAKPLETREDAEMKRVQALPEGPEGEAQLVAEDIAKAVEMVDVSDIAGVSPVPALVRIIRRAARDPAMKTAAEQAMQKIGAAAREQGVPLDTIKQEIAGELKAIYGADAAEMAKAYFGEETPAPEVPKAPETAASSAFEVTGKVRGMTPDELANAVLTAVSEGGMVQGLKEGPGRDGFYVVAPPDRTIPGDEAMAIGPFKTRKDARMFLESEVGAEGAKVVHVRERIAPLQAQLPQEPAKEAAPAIERIVATAVRNPSTGQIASAPNKIHVQLYNEVGLDPTRLSSKQVAESSGYMTDRGRFVTQDEGQRLAQEAKQIGAREELMGEVVRERLSKTAVQPKTPAPVAVAKAQAEVSKVAATEGKRSAKEIKDDLVKELTKAWAEAPDAVDAAKPTVTISIPGDGEFTLTNTSAAIESVLKRAKKIQTSAEAKTFFPRGSVESSAKAIQATFTPKPEPLKPGPGATGSVGFFPRRSEALGMGEASMPPTVEDVRRQRQRDLAPPPNEPPPSQPGPPPETPEAAITDAPKPKDVMPARNWWTSSEFEFQTIPEAAPLVTKLVEAELGFGAQVGRDIQRFNEIKANLSKAEQIQVTKALREAQKGNPALLEALPENLRTAADEVRNYFEDVKKVIIAEKKRELIEALPDARGRAVQDILGGMPEAQAFRRNRLRAAGQATVRSAIQELKELDNWGPEDYVTNIERGSYRVVDPNGTTVAIALTRVGAKEKALQYAKEHPNVKSLTITDEFDPGIESPTKLSKGQYYRTISRLSQAVGETASEVQRLLRADGSIIAIKPTNKYAGPLQRRRNILKGEENLWDALPTYAYSVRKKLALDPVLKEVRESLNTLPENARQQVEELANDVKGRKTVADKMVDYLLSPLGTQPFGYSRGVNLARRITTIAKLGYRPVTALINRLSGMQHTWTRAGTQWFLEGRRFMNTPEFKEVWEANRDYVGDAATAFTEGARQGAVPWWHPLSMFQWAEHVNRPEAFATFYRFAQGELKMSPPEAAAYARWQTRFAQFVYTTGSLPRMFRGPTGRLVGQFKPYLVRELEFLSSLDSRQWPRYLAGFMALGGPRAVVYMLRSLPFLGAAGVFYAIEDWLNRKAPATSRGVGGAVGVDVTAAVTPQFPSRSEDWAGPTLSSLVTLYRDIIEPAMSGEKRDVRDLAQWGAKLAPMTSYWYDLVESALHREGWNVDAQGRPDYKPSTADKIKMAVGAQPLEKSIQAVESRYLNHLDDITRANRKHLVDRFIRALDANDPEEMDRMIAQFADYGITSDTIKDAMKQRHREPRERLRQRLLKVLRPTLAEREAENP